MSARTEIELGCELGGRFRLSSDLGMVSSDASDRLMRLMECYSVHVSSSEEISSGRLGNGWSVILYMYRARTCIELGGKFRLGD